MLPILRIIHLSLLLFISTSLLAQERGKTTLSLVWKTDSILPVPESVLLDKQNGVLYVSLIGAGDHTAMDGNGGIGKLNLKGEPIDLQWATGLHSPKGIDRYKDKLFVADLKELVIIDLKTGTTLNKIEVPEAGMLNDVAAASDGSIFVSDSKGGSIYRFHADSYTKVMDDLTNPNGLLIHGNLLYYVDSGRLYSCDLAGKHLQLLAENMLSSTDGLQMTKEGDFIISCWIGALYFVGKNGEVELLQDSRNEKKNTADIAYDIDDEMLYVPTFFKKSIEVYKLNSD